MESTGGSAQGCSQYGPQVKVPNEKYDFIEVRNIVNDFIDGDVEKRIIAVQELIRLLEQYPELSLKLNDETNLRNSLIDALKANPPPNLKEQINKILPKLDAKIPAITSDEESFLDKFRPILLKPEHLEFNPKTRIVKFNHGGYITVPFDPVFTVPNAPIRPMIDNVSGKHVDRKLLNAQFTVNAGVAYCGIFFSTDIKLEQNKIPLRIGIVDADYPLVHSSQTVIGKTKGGVSFDSEGFFWINGSAYDTEEHDKQWTRNQEIGMEVDMNASPRTIKFFVGKEQIKNYISNIPARFRFFASTSIAGDWFQVQSLFIHKVPFGLHRTGDKEWKVNDSQYDYTTGM
ncbi:MAG: hypothetical protein EZS28_001787 [Streblomastix strix]|uniref:SPRY domain-containing protein n=1 Tax=Streblomastix strix TaxID=222440 RepID=A0A5J4X7H3_9EUKA|nr:MAG: hypothetical protein EZS28_001787 [Streblomastix strix]